MRKFMYALLTLVVAFGLVRCGGDDEPTDPDPNQSPTVDIASPSEGATFGADEEVTLEGSAEDPEDGPLTGTALVWSSDVDGELGTGETVTTTLTEGDHTITLEATDSENATDSEAVSITVGEQAGGDFVDITIDDNVFIDPDGNENTEASVTIDLGTSVRWTYVSSGSAIHTVTWGEGIGGDDGDGVPDGGTPENSGEITPGGTFTFTPNVAGTWTYYCEIHPGIMYEATIVVNEG